MARLHLCSVLAAVCIVAAAAQKPTFLLDNIGSSHSTSPKAHIANYYDDTEVACLSQLNFKNCRYTGCPVESAFDSAGAETATCAANTGTVCLNCWPDSIYFQSDFTCCAKEHSYSHSRRHDLDTVGFADKVSTCDWEISMYRTPYRTNVVVTGGGSSSATVSDPWTPLKTEDEAALKFGTAWGTCYLNADADHCDSPLCERMAISIQGGLYAACAYSPQQSATFAARQDICDDDEALPPWLSSILENAAQNPAMPAVSRFEKYLNYIKAYACKVLGPTCGQGDSATCGYASISSVKEEIKASVAYDREYSEYSHEEEKLYPGIALIISGPMYITSKKDKSFEETGLFEMALDFSTSVSTAVSDPTNRWPMVRGKGAKLRFTREESHEQPRHEERYDGRRQ